MIYLVLITHWIADFILQSRFMGQNKSSSNYVLTLHILVYTCCLLPFGWKFALINGAAHWVTDWVSSRLSGYFYKQSNMHMFFVVIGADQMIHTLTLIHSMRWIDV